MKTSRLWIVGVLLALLCVGTALALYLAKDESPLSEPAETSAPEQGEAQSTESTPEAPSPLEQTDENTGVSAVDDPSAPTESADPVSGEGAAPAPTEGATPAPGVIHTPVPGERHTPAPQDSAAPVPTAPTQPGTHTSAPPDTAAPTAPATHSPAAGNPTQTPSPAPPAPTVPVSPGGSGPDAARIDELYAELNALRSEAISQLAALADQAEAEWLSIRDKHPSRRKFITKYYDQAAELEASYDARVDALCNELQYLLDKTGGDLSIVRQIRSEYDAEKESARAEYYRRFMTLLDL
ncbi:MAG: hypothetical protein IKH03_03760 [Oscillospiraceae bacterium]|nr:hypothetical protein [Oscillospiraceae bacterium]